MLFRSRSGFVERAQETFFILTFIFVKNTSLTFLNLTSVVQCTKVFKTRVGMTMPRRIKLIVEYDGTNFKGFQVQNGAEAGAMNGDSVRTVQGDLEQALSKLVKQPIRISGASRTDTGVHARGQAASFLLPDEFLIPTSELCAALNYNLEWDLCAVRAEEVDLNFHAQRDSTGKIYTYSIFARPERSALFRRNHWHVRYPLNVEAMQNAARALVGVHDFTSFASNLTQIQEKRVAVGKDPLETVREINRIEVLTDERLAHRIFITVEGSGFLYQMVRTIAGSLVDVGRGYRNVEWMGEALAARDRRKAGPTAPPQGLCLEVVKYHEPLPLMPIKIDMSI
jgi:tRNA pseudouridine38-40 synthase